MADQPNKAANTYQLSDLANFIRRVFALNLPEAVWVTAEIGQSNGSRDNQWLTLVQKDEQTDGIVTQLDAVVWKTRLGKLRRQYGAKLVRDLFQSGMAVRLRVLTNFHPRYGLRLTVEDIDPAHTLGTLEQRRQKTLGDLAAQGLLRRNGALQLTELPLRLAVISSSTAAGLADFQEQLRANPYGYKFKTRLFPAAMQGAQTSPEVLARLKQILLWPEDFDAVLIIRGGGGRTDLAAFDDENLARGVAEYPLPVITGIGHETDDAVLDRVAHTALKTPTAAAVFLIERLVRAENHLLQTSRAIANLATAGIHRRGQRVSDLQRTIQNSARSILQRQNIYLDQTERALRQQPQRILQRESATLAGLERVLTALRPEYTLARGYALVIQDGRIVTTPKDLEPGEVELRLNAGRATLIKPT